MKRDSRQKRKAKGAKPVRLWGGRFSEGRDPEAEAYMASVHFDSKLAPYDVRGSIAHARMLGRRKIIPPADARKIITGLEAIGRDIAAGRFRWDPDAEDVHMNIEKELTRRIGATGGRLHTARSRNDQVAVDVRLYLRDRIDHTADLLKDLVAAFVKTAAGQVDTVLPGYTHLQRAQPVSLAHHLLAYAAMFWRDRERLLDARKRVNLLPLGSGAIAGSPYDLDREGVAKELGFDGITRNSMDAVADRDPIVEFLSVANLSALHLSRLAEELVLWSSAEFGFVRLAEPYTSGSSLMPQKRNPDVAELMRGKSGRVFGSLATLSMAVKGLPLTYNRDLQEDKEPLFDAAETWTAGLTLAARMIRTARFNAQAMRAAVSDPLLLATDLADILVGEGMPFREAHEEVGKLVAFCEKSGRSLTGLDDAALRKAGSKIRKWMLGELSPLDAVDARAVTGGTARREVRKELARWQKLLQEPAQKRTH